MTKPYFTYGVQASDRDLITSTTTYAGKHKRYFSSLDAEIFIGDERVEDIVRIDFTYEEKKMPIYGFNSFLPSKVLVGQKIIQGTFVINFTEVGYLVNLLEKVKDSEIANKYDKIGISCDPWNNALFKKCFDIVIGYGGYNIENETSYNSTFQILQGVYINGYQQILDTSGEPIKEVYSFIARNLAYKSTDGSGNIANDMTQKPEEESNSNDHGYAIVEKRIVSEVNRIKGMAQKNKNFLGIITDVVAKKYDKSTSRIIVSFPEILNKKEGDKIDKVKLTISDNELNISKTFSLNYFDKKWVAKLNKEETDRVMKKINDNKLVNCLIEFELKRNDINATYTVNKHVGMHKTVSD